MTLRLPSLPVSLRVPLLAGAAVFLFATATSQVALRAMGHRLDGEAARLGRVYLDGLSAAVLPAIQAGDRTALGAALERALGFHAGIRERRLAVATPEGALLAAAGVGPDPDWPAHFHRGVRGEAWEFSEDGDAVWAQRVLVDSGRVVALLAAKLDVSSIAESRRRLELALLAFGLALAVLGAALSAFAARRAMRPVLGVSRALGRVGAGRLAPIPDAEMPPPDTEAGRLAAAFNAMVACLAERERLLARLAERERAAVLGRLAATVAHEVRNPLAGMLTAVETARRFGDVPTERAEALDVLERGLRQVEGVVSSTLALHRDHGPPRPLAAADLEDLRVLVAPAAERRGVALDWRVALPEPFDTDAPPVRQAALNLLLNAVAATPPGGRVALDARVEAGGHLALAVVDSGPGLPPDSARRLCLPAAEAEEDGPAPGGLGLEVIAALARRLSARIAAEPGPGGKGTRVTLRVPPDDGIAAPPPAQAEAVPQGTPA